MTSNSAPSSESLIARAKAILLTPKDEWPRIVAEPLGIGDIFRSYVLPLAAIGPVAGFIGSQLFGYSALGISFRPSLVAGISAAITSFILSLVSVFVLTAIVEFLASKFEGSTTRLNAFKLVAYSFTASWLAGIFGILPSLAWLGIVGLYSFYLLYTGVVPLVNVPAAKAATFTVVTVVCAIILSLVVGAIAASITGLFARAPSFSSDAGEVSGSVAVPGVGTIDVGKMQEAAKKADAAALQALLPTTVAGFSRTSVESQALGQAGSNAEGRYEKAGKSFTLSLTDMSAMGALASMGAAMGVSSNKEDANGYEKTATVDGHIVTEKWNKTDGRGEYGTTLADRFMVKAQGEVDSIDTLKEAVASIDAGSLGALVK